LREVTNYNDEREVRIYLETLQEAIEEHDCAVLGLGHLNKKGGGDLTALERVMGTVAFVNFVRSVLIVGWDKEEECPRLIHAATNLDRREEDLFVKLTNKNEDSNGRGPFVSVNFEDAADQADPDEFLDRSKPTDKAPKKDSAGDWLINYLEKQPNKEATVQDIYKEGLAAGLQENTIRQARKRNANISAVESNKLFFWRLVF